MTLTPHLQGLRSVVILIFSTKPLQIQYYPFLCWVHLFMCPQGQGAPARLPQFSLILVHNLFVGLKGCSGMGEALHVPVMRTVIHLGKGWIPSCSSFGFMIKIL